MPVSFLSNEQRENYGHYTGVPSLHDLARYFHLDDADLALIAKKRGDHNRLGFAVQLGTVRYLGTFLDDPMAVPVPVLHTLAKQLRIEAVNETLAYSTGEQRWQHATEIRAAYGYVEITEQQVAFRLTRWLYALCWTGTDRPSVVVARSNDTLLACEAGWKKGCGARSPIVSTANSRLGWKTCLPRQSATAARNWIACAPVLPAPPARRPGSSTLCVTSHVVARSNSTPARVVRRCPQGRQESAAAHIERS